MKIVLIFTVIVVAVVCQEKYTNRYDDIDLDGILKNERLLKNYIDCLLDRGKCSKDARELKKYIPEALETQCAKCSEKHINGVRRVIKYLSENKTEWWNELVKKYDPQGIYKNTYKELSKTEGIKV